jgi:hypothetical protein
MAILQAIMLMIYQVQLTALFAYFPEIVSTYICEAKSFLQQPTKWNAMRVHAIIRCRLIPHHDLFLSQS